MKLRKLPHPDPDGSALYYSVHAAHRDNAITLAIDVLRDACKREVEATPDDNLGKEFSTTACDWAIESLIQGGWMREFHMWELATKAYFDGQHLRNGAAKVDWKKRPPRGAPAASHVDKVKAQLGLFGASVPGGAIDAIDRARNQVNAAKHEEEIFVTEAGYRELVAAVATFWDALELQEAFTPPVSIASKSS